MSVGPASRLSYDVVTIGAVTVDFTQPASERFLQQTGFVKGASTLISEQMFSRLNDSTNIVLKSIGGVSTNIATAIALNGGKVALIAKTGRDENGRFYAEQIKKYGISYTPIIDSVIPTTALMSYVTPDKERSFAVLGGAGCRISGEDIDFSLLADTRIIHIETFILQSAEGCNTAAYLTDTINKMGGRLAISLNSAPLMAEKRALIQSLVDRADIVTGNINEFKTLYEVDSDRQALDIARRLKAIVALTQGSRNAYVTERGKHHVIPVKAERKLVDTSGAGDQFTAGLLKGLADGYHPLDAARQGVLWASYIIRHYGALPRQRPPTLKNRMPHISDGQYQAA